jgi:type I restriction enzyme S subunit
MSWLCLNAVRFAFDINTSYRCNQPVPTHLKESRAMKQATRQYVPFQPLAEKHRIAAKVDALTALCDRLEASLTATTRSKLRNANLHKAPEPPVLAVAA